MLALSLGVAWLLLAPLCLWLLIKGSNGERAGAIVTLALLEGGTIAMQAAPHPSAPAPPPAAHALPPAPLSCDERAPVPESAKVGRQVVLTWAATARECRTADVVVRTKGRKLLVWLHESPWGQARATMVTRSGRKTFTLPVRVHDGIAALAIPLNEKSGYIPIDGRSGRRIPNSGNSASRAAG